jgi:transcriptional regulator with XRE-family HTH domain
MKIPYACRIKNLREATGHDLEEMASKLDMTYMSYFDIELHDDEIVTVPKMKKVFLLASILGVTPYQLLADDPSVPRQSAVKPLTDLKCVILQEIEKQEVKQAALENEVGWYLTDFLANPEESIEVYPLLFLQDICNHYGLNWYDYIPG